MEELLDKLNALETNFTTVDDTVSLISSATRVRIRLDICTLPNCNYVAIYIAIYRIAGNF